ncbi:MAG: DUF3520 domain-containing protein [Deltaproteobacteria bacterium]|nr:DUF3520 domain-containing protein [Deltaproteobacteria bacterium]
MRLDLSYELPQGRRRFELSVPVYDAGLELAETSTDYRFSAAVAGFAEKLRGPKRRQLGYAEIIALAEGAIGSDRDCRRHQFVDLVWQASVLAGEELARPDTSCTPESERAKAVEPIEAERARVIQAPSEHSIVAPGVHADEHESESDWQEFVVEVLRLLPPFLALPMFVTAFSQRRRE